VRNVSGLIERRRLELALSRRELADQVGCRIGAVQALENGGDLGNWPLRLVQTLLTALGLTWTDLEKREDAAADATDVERLGAELVRTGRLRDVDVRAAAADGALPALRAKLEQIGMTVAETEPGHLELVACDDVPGLPRVFEEVSDRLAAGHLTGPEEEVVAAIANGSLDRQRLSHSRSRALASLLRAGLIKEEDDGFVLNGPAAVAFTAARSCGQPRP
jgi:transcriptional regulator with XRE-family HTH domain